MTAVADDTRLSPMALVRALIRERMETMGRTDLAAIADILIEEGLPDDCQLALMREAIIAEGMKQNSDIRRPVRGHGSAPQSKRWDNVRAVRESDPDVFQIPWNTRDGQKILGDFTREDAIWTHKWYLALARGNAAQASKFAKLAKILPPGKFAHSLPREQVEAIFFDA